MGKEKKQIVVIESAPSDTLTKMAKTLRKRGYETVFITLVGNIEIKFLKESYDIIISFDSRFFKINLLSLPSILLHGLKKSSKILKALYKIKKLKPYVIIGRAPPSWLSFLFRMYFRAHPFIYFPYDIRSFSYKDRREAISEGIPFFELNSERYCFKNSDGIIHKGDEEELKHLNMNILGNISIRCPNIYFFPYCLKDFIVSIKRKEKLSYKDKKIHTVYVGHVPSDKGWINGLKKIIDQNIYLHLYSRTNNITKEEEMKRVKKILKRFLNNKYLILHESVSQKELSKEISKYDYGWYGYSYIAKKMYANATGNKIPSYLEAGLPIISPFYYISANKTLKNKSVGIIINKKEFSNLRQVLRKNKPKRFEQNILKTREELSMENQVLRLEEFFKEVIKYKK